MLFAVRKGCVGASFDVWGAEGRSVDHPMNDYLNHFATVCNTRVSTALGELALVIPRSITDQFSLLFLPETLRLWNLLSSGMLSGGTLGLFKSAMNLYLLRA